MTGTELYGTCLKKRPPYHLSAKNKRVHDYCQTEVSLFMKF